MARVVFAALAVAVPVAPAIAKDTGCKSRRCVERVAAKHCSQRRVVPCIERAAIHYRVSYAMLLRKARCESRLNPYARNPSSSASGLFQFLFPSTWSSTPYRRHSVWSAKYNALAAAWMHRVGRGAEWECQ